MSVGYAPGMSRYIEPDSTSPLNFDMNNKIL